MAVLFTIAGLEFELISLIVGAFVGYVTGSIAAKLRYSSGMMMSDKNLKTDTKSFDSKNFLDSLKAYAYKFKGSSEQKFGVMAQDLEKSDAGKSIVKDTFKGKAIDTTQGFGLVLAALSDINKRLSDLENRYKAK